MASTLRRSNRIKIAKRVALELKDGQSANLGVGIPTLIPDYLGDKHLYLQSENGLLGMGPTPSDGQIDMDLISASKKPITTEPGASIFDSTDSFAMIRGGHIDLAILGALQVDKTGEIANWAVPGATILGVGGSMDLVSGVKEIIVAMFHTDKDGKSKIVNELTYPSSGNRKIGMVITDHAVFTFHKKEMMLIEVISNLTVEEIREITDVEFQVAQKLANTNVLGTVVAE